jgi:hypothetical protein
MTYQEQLDVYKKEAYEYFSNMGISPCPEEIVEFVCECVEENSGCEVDDDTFFGIAKKIGITIED